MAEGDRGKNLMATMSCLSIHGIILPEIMIKETKYVIIKYFVSLIITIVIVTDREIDTFIYPPV